MTPTDRRASLDQQIKETQWLIQEAERHIREWQAEKRKDEGRLKELQRERKAVGA